MGRLRVLFWRFKCAVLVGGHKWAPCGMGASNFTFQDETGDVMTVHLHTYSYTCPECGSFKTDYAPLVEGDGQLPDCAEHVAA
jgi:hypothetical protein